MQTFTVFITLSLLGGRRGGTAILVYLLLGAVGLPVFAGFHGGLGVLLDPTSGFLPSFIIAGPVYGLITYGHSSSWRRLMALLATLLLRYVCGTAWFVVVYSQMTVSWTAALATCILPFIIPDLAKLALAVTLSKRLRFHLPVFTEKNTPDKETNNER